MAQGGTGGQQIARLEKGDSTRTAMHADVMNEIIDAINKMLALTVSPQDAGKFIWADANGVLQIEGGGGEIEVAADEEMEDFAEGETSITAISKITFDGALFKIHDNGGGEAQIQLITTDCAAESGIDGGSA